MKGIKRFVSMTGFLLLILVVTGGWAKEGRDPRRLLILFTHDLHSYFLPYRVATEGGAPSLQGGYAKIASLIRAQRSLHGEKTLLVDAGDFSMGTLFHTAFLTESSELRLMGEMGYDVQTFGNHDFDFHADGLALALKVAKSKSRRLPAMVASNVVFRGDPSGDQSLQQAFRDYPVKDYQIVEKNGLRIGIFGLMGKDAADDSPFARPASFADPIESSKRVVGILKTREKVDLIVCLSHSGTSPVRKRSEDEILARKVPEIDVIISGHTHTVLPKPIVVGKTVIVSSGAYGAYLGILALDCPKGGGVTVASYRLRPVSPEVPDDPAVAASIAEFGQIVDQQYLSRFGYHAGEVIAQSDFDMTPLAALYGDPREAGLGNLITDAYRYAVEQAEGSQYDYIHLVMEPIGHIRDSFLRGPITVSDVFRVLSLGRGTDGMAGYPLVALYITGEEMKKLLEIETTVSSLKEDAHLQVSGVKFTFNPHRVPFDRVTSLSVREAGGVYRPVEAGRLYRVCMNFYSANMVDFVRLKSHGLLTFVPKDREGRPLKDLRQAVVDADEGRSGTQELKEWVALAAYLKSLPTTGGDGLPTLPDRYRKGEGRFSAAASWAPQDLIAGGGVITYGVLGAGLLLLGVLGFLIWFLKRRFFPPARPTP